MSYELYIALRCGSSSCLHPGLAGLACDELSWVERRFQDSKFYLWWSIRCF